MRPRARRDSAPLLCCLASSSLDMSDLRVWDLLHLLRAGDVVVMNDTKVVPSRLEARYSDPQGVEHAVVVTLAERLDSTRWLALVKGARHLQRGVCLRFIDACGREVFCAEVISREHELRGMLTLRFEERLAGDRLYDHLEGNSNGEGSTNDDGMVLCSMPLPPYIKRAADARDLEDYQTLFARRRGALAAPTAGRHITPRLLEALKGKGVDCLFITLHVGLGSFQAVRVSNISEHSMASERVEVSSAVLSRIACCKRAGGRVLAVGTTVVRALESAARNGVREGGVQVAGSSTDFCAETLATGDYNGKTRLYITPGFRFRLVDLLLTNFHQSRSTPLILTCAFAGVASVARAYSHARATMRYRFFSYGDACLFAKDGYLMRKNDC